MDARFRVIRDHLSTRMTTHLPPRSLHSERLRGYTRVTERNFFFFPLFIYLFFFSIVSKDYRRLYTKRQSKKSCDNSRLPLILADGNAVSALSDVTFVGERTIISINRNPLLPPLFIAHAFEFAHESSIRPSFRLFASFRSKFRA